MINVAITNKKQYYKTCNIIKLSNIFAKSEKSFQLIEEFIDLIDT
jgi:hypothetical protein